MNKSYWRCRVCGDIHFGSAGPELCPTCQVKDAYDPAEQADALACLSDLGTKKIWRCNVCNDLHLGNFGPALCPTCNTADAFVEINQSEFTALI